MKLKFGSALFLSARRGTPGRRLTRNLNDAAVERAQVKSQDLRHQMKFWSPLKRWGFALHLALDKDPDRLQRHRDPADDSPRIVQAMRASK